MFHFLLFCFVFYCLVSSCPVLFCLAFPGFVLSSLVSSRLSLFCCFLSSLVLSFLALSYFHLSFLIFYHILWFIFIEPFLFWLSSPLLFCLIFSCHVSYFYWSCVFIPLPPVLTRSLSFLQGPIAHHHQRPRRLHRCRYSGTPVASRVAEKGPRVRQLGGGGGGQEAVPAHLPGE